MNFVSRYLIQDERGFGTALNVEVLIGAMRED